jgi:mRNA interferase HigB
MHIITRKRLNDFAVTHPDVKVALQHWYKLMKANEFSSFVDLKTIFPSADRVGNLTVFNIGGKKPGSLPLYTTTDVKFIFGLC